MYPIDQTWKIEGRIVCLYHRWMLCLQTSQKNGHYLQASTQGRMKIVIGGSASVGRNQTWIEEGPSIPNIERPGEY